MNYGTVKLNELQLSIFLGSNQEGEFTQNLDSEGKCKTLLTVKGFKKENTG